VQFLNESVRELNMAPGEEEDTVAAAHINVEKNFAFVDASNWQLGECCG
jgi:hypothetical protein